MWSQHCSLVPQTLHLSSGHSTVGHHCVVPFPLSWLIIWYTLRPVISVYFAIQYAEAWLRQSYTILWISHVPRAVPLLNVKLQFTVVQVWQLFREEACYCCIVNAICEAKIRWNSMFQSCLPSPGWLHVVIFKWNSDMVANPKRFPSSVLR